MEEEQDYCSNFWVGLEDNSDSEEDIYLLGQHSMSSSSETYTVGFVMADVVEIQHYGYILSDQLKVGLKREPQNLYDKNAIKVFLAGNIKVGSIEDSVAAILSPMMKSKLIFIEGIVSYSCPARNQTKIPCQMRIFAPHEAFQTVKSAILEGGLKFSEENKVEKEKKGVDEIFKKLEGSGWLFHRENSSDLPPFWEEKENGSYFNLLYNFHTTKRPEPLRAGIFADDTGMGKTLTLLSLIAFDICDSASSFSRDTGRLDVDKSHVISKQDEVFSVSGGKRRRISEIISIEVNSVGIVSKSATDIDRKTTLVVCPPSVVETWEEHLNEHTGSGKLKIYKYYGERAGDPEELRKYDIVLTTYTLSVLKNYGQFPLQRS
ncbi:putative Helicase [Quillaja saponaria]|uniref:Helicase n=1 Tax=Quillaja saponaria TaxID=32244 RepID=A0AAD7PZI7_QUISA|nr:putative Helicase [Quillaja saponaria]